MTSHPDAARYRQVAAALRQRIEGGEWPVGARIPGRRELAATLGVAGATIDRAVGVLAGEGMLESVPGAGTFVRQDHAVPPRAVADRVAALEAWRAEHEREHGP